MDKVRGALKSKTVWFNVITAVVETVNLSSGLMPPGVGVLISALGNIALRFLTDKPLEAK
jgi:hypothetical protein